MYTLSLEIHRDDVLLQSNHPGAFKLLVDAIGKTRWSYQTLALHQPPTKSNQKQPTNRKRCARKLYGETTTTPDKQLPTLLVEVPNILTRVSDYVQFIGWCRTTLSLAYSINETAPTICSKAISDEHGSYQLRTVFFSFASIPSSSSSSSSSSSLPSSMELDEPADSPTSVIEPLIKRICIRH